MAIYSIFVPSSRADLGSIILIEVFVNTSAKDHKCFETLKRERMGKLVLEIDYVFGWLVEYISF